MTVISPRLVKPYGGYNTLLDSLNRLRDKVPNEVRICITWTAYWARFQWIRPRPFWVYVHGKEIGYRGGWLWSRLQDHVYRQAEGIVAISVYTRNDLLRHFSRVDPWRVTVVHHGIDPPPMIRGPESGSATFRLISIGQWIPRKGFYELLAVVNHLSGESPIHLDILTEAACPVADSTSVTIHRNVSEEVKWRLLARADAFVLLNRHVGPDYEGFGYVVVEAMSMGLPCVVGREGGPAEIVRHGVDGFVVDPTDSADVEGALRMLMTDPECCRDMGRSASQQARSVFSHAAFEQRLLETIGGRI